MMMSRLLRLSVNRMMMSRLLRIRKRKNPRQSRKKELQMGLFEKKVLIYRKRDRKTWEQIRDVLNKEGIRCSCSHHEQENIPVGGYSAMDPRNFGKGGRIDREIYTVRVKVSLESSAREALRNAGIVSVVEDIESLTQDAAQKYKDIRY